MIVKIFAGEDNNTTCDTYVVDDAEYEFFVSNGFKAHKLKFPLDGLNTFVSYSGVVEDTTVHNILNEYLDDHTKRFLNFEIFNTLFCIILTKPVKRDLVSAELIEISSEVYECLQPMYFDFGKENSLFTKEYSDSFKRSFILVMCSYIPMFTNFLNIYLCKLKEIAIERSYIESNETICSYDDIRAHDIEDLSEIITNTSVRLFYSYGGVDVVKNIRNEDYNQMFVVFNVFRREKFMPYV